MEKQPIKGLPRNAQLRILAIGAAAVAGVLILVPVLRDALTAKPEPALPKLVQGGFRPDSAQWANITLGTVTARKFPGLVSVEAQVATDDETTTQVFSPFTGQVLEYRGARRRPCRQGAGAGDGCRQRSDAVGRRFDGGGNRLRAMPTPMRHANTHFIMTAARR